MSIIEGKSEANIMILHIQSGHKKQREWFSQGSKLSEDSIKFAT